MPFSQPIGAPKGSLRSAESPAAIYDDAPPGTWWYVFKDCSPFSSVEFTFRWFGNADPSDLDVGRVVVIWYTDLSLSVVAWVDTFYLPNANRENANSPAARDFVHLQVRGKVCTVVAPTSADTTASLTVTAQGSNRELSKNVFASADDSQGSASNLVLVDIGGALSGGTESTPRMSGLLSGRVMVSVVAHSFEASSTRFRFQPYPPFGYVDLTVSGTGEQNARAELLVHRGPLQAFTKNLSGTTDSWHYAVIREEF